MEVREVSLVSTERSWSEHKISCSFQQFGCWNMEWFVTGTRSPANRTKSWWKYLTTFGAVFNLDAHSASLFSALQVCEPNFEAFHTPKSSQIPSSSPLLSWCESVRLCFIQLTYSNVHWFKIHLMCQSMSAGLLGCLSLSWKITFLLKKGRRQHIRDQSERTRFSLSPPKSVKFEGH